MNTRCPDIELDLAAFAAGELAPVAAEGVARHVAVCAGCRGELEREVRLRAALAALPAVPAPRDLGRRPAPARRRVPWPGLGGLAAAALLLALLAGLPRSPQVGPGGPAALYSADQVAAARRDAARSLVLAARILERTELHALSDVFGQRLPRAVAGSLRPVPPTPEGGQG